MDLKREPLETIRNLVGAGDYRLRSHCLRHMIEEGFDETHLLEAILGNLQLLEEYSEEQRYLVLGYFYFSSHARSALHLVCDLSNAGLVDIVTAYIPQYPWWSTPTQRRE